MISRQESPEDSKASLAQVLSFDPSAEGLDLAPDETDALLATARTLRAAPVPTPHPEETERLVAALAPYVPEPARPTPATQEPHQWLGAALAAARPHVRLLRRPFWVASAAVVASGLPLLDPGIRQAVAPDLTYAAFLVLVAPVLATLGVAYAFRGAGTGMAEVEMTCALTPAQLVLGRLFWVTAYDALLLGLASLAAAEVEPGVRVGWLVAGWLAPMLLLAALVLGLSLYLSPWAAAGAALALWSVVPITVVTRPELGLPVLAGSPAAAPMVLVVGAGAVLLLAAVVAAAPHLMVRLAGFTVREGV